MFEVGDRVVCVDAGPSWSATYGGKPADWSVPLVKGQIYIVRAILGPQRILGNPEVGALWVPAGGVDVGQPAVCRLNGWVLNSWNPSRFRKLRDISQSLRELKELAINCPALADACERGGW